MLVNQVVLFLRRHHRKFTLHAFVNFCCFDAVDLLPVVKLSFRLNLEIKGPI